MSERIPLLSTVHGSWLYGLNHADSDEDYYTVVTRLPHVAHNGTRARYARQTISGVRDHFIIDLSTFMLLCDKGVPQALEAMFSPVADVDLISDLRASYRVSTAVLPTYLRTIRSFLKAGDTKRRRHAVRLALNAQSIVERGFFNPRLTPEQSAITREFSEIEDIEELEEILRSWVLETA